MRNVLLAVFLCGAAVLGCQTFSGRANPAWVADLEQADSLNLRTGEFSRKITEPKAIKRFREIYTKATWKPYVATLPFDLNKHTIEIYQKRTRLRLLAFTGDLWELEEDPNKESTVRTAELSDSDREWLETLFQTTPSS
ncbi:hypothetical protein [Lignipirellula cremea]|nr:hypothetical protein [Lignipirellula cremea]